MIPHQRDFSFANAGGVEEDDLIRVQRLMGSHDYPRRSRNLRSGGSGNYEDFGNQNRLEFQWLDREKEDEGVSSPPLWKGSLKEEHNPAAFGHGHDHDHGEYPLPLTRLQTIAKYRQEMMELVQHAPEPAYELSLRDLVELPKMTKAVEEAPEGDGRSGKEKEQQKKAGRWKKQIMRSQSMESGVFLLKMFFPTPFGGRRKSRASKVSPKPALCSGKKGEMESCNGAGDMCRSSSNSSSNGSPRSRKMSGCYSFFHTSREKVKTSV